MDGLLEGDEDFNLNLVNTSAATTATNVTIDEDATVETTTITDNDEANGPPIADDDFIVTNIVDGSDIFITIVALLINDSDPDGDSLVDFTITGSLLGGNATLVTIDNVDYVQFDPSTVPFLGDEVGNTNGVNF